MNSPSISQTMYRKAFEMFDSSPAYERGNPNDPVYWRPDKFSSPRYLWEDRPVLYAFFGFSWNALYVGYSTNLWDRIINHHSKTSWWANECCFVYFLDYDIECEQFGPFDLESSLIRALDPKYNSQQKFRSITKDERDTYKFIKEFIPIKA